MRFWQIDAARGLAIAGMVFYHFLVDVEMIFQIPIGVYETPVVIIARVVATLFILLMGMSAAIKFETVKKDGVKKAVLGFGKRAFQILIWALIISGITFILFPEDVIIFGILHFIGLSLILIIPFLFLNNRLLALIGTLFLWLGIVVVPYLKISTYWLLVFGITPVSFRSLDYFPLFPWFEVVLFGLILGRKYWQRQPKEKFLLNQPESGVSLILVNIGQKSLLIYLLHQPILWGSLLIFKQFISQ